MKHLILASQSPFRVMLMRNAGLTFEAQPANIDERAIEATLQNSATTPQDLALILAQHKALDVSTRNSDALVIGSDQTLSLGARVFHKPVDQEDARRHLAALSAKTHQLNSAVVLAHNGQILWKHVSIARLTMRDLSPAFIDHHLARVGDSVLSSVGAYQYEKEGIQLFEHVDGDYFTIVGLPLIPLLTQLRLNGAIDG